MRSLLAAVGFLLAAGAAIPCVAQGAAQAPAPAPAVADPSPENLAVAREIVDLALPPESRQAMMERMSDALFAQMRDGMSRSTGNLSDPGLQRLLDRYLERFRILTNELSNESAPAMFEAVARAYARAFSHDDLVQIRAFASTPAGRRYFRHAPELFSDPDVAETNRAYMARMFAALRPLMDEMGREIEAHTAPQQRR